jgi:hypothetical protein
MLGFSKENIKYHLLIFLVLCGCALISFQEGVIKKMPFFSEIYAASCDTIFNHHDIIVGDYKSPISGSAEDSKNFNGYSVFRYLYPGCPDLNTADLPKLFEFKSDGSFEMADNFAIGGDETFFLGEGGGGFKSENLKESNYNMKFYHNNSEVSIGGGAEFYGGYSSGVNEESMPAGPSIYLNKGLSGINFAGKFSLTPASGRQFMVTNFSVEDPEIKSLLEFSSQSNPVSLEKKDDFFYIVDRGERKIIRYSTSTEEFLSLGKSDWGWEPADLTVEEMEEDPDINFNNIYITDSLNDRVIQTKINGNGWRDTTYIKKSYYKKLLLTGEEEFHHKYGDINDGKATSTVFLLALGNNRHKVIASSTQGHLDYNANEEQFDFVTDLDKVFEEKSFDFNGQRTLIVPDHGDFRFHKDPFVIEFWVRFKSLSHNQTFLNKQDSYKFSWINRRDNPEATSTLAFSVYHKGQPQEISVEKDWEPERFEWYHISVVADQRYEMRYNINVDGERLTESSVSSDNLNNSDLTPLIDSGNDLVIGGNSFRDENYLEANIDNFRIIKENPTQYYNEYSYNPHAVKYYFDDPRGITHFGDYLYVVDGGQDRVVKLQKPPKENEVRNISLEYWDTFGNSGSGNYQFNNPTLIYRDESEFDRICRSDLGVGSGADCEWSADEVESSEPSSMVFEWTAPVNDVEGDDIRVTCWPSINNKDAYKVYVKKNENDAWELMGGVNPGEGCCYCGGCHSQDYDIGVTSYDQIRFIKFDKEESNEVYCSDSSQDTPYFTTINGSASGGRGYFYIVDAGNERIVKTDMATTSQRFKNYNFTQASWKVFDYSDFYESLDGSQVGEEFHSKTFYIKYFDSSRSSEWNVNLTSYLENMPYENSRIKIAIKGRGLFDVTLTDNNSFDLTKQWSSGNSTLSFDLPDDFSLTDSDLYLKIRPGGTIKFVKAILSKQLEIGGMSIKGTNMFITDKNNGALIYCKDMTKTMDCSGDSVAVVGGHNYQEKEMNNPERLEQFHYLYDFIAPTGIFYTTKEYEGEPEMQLYVLDGVSGSNITIEERESSSPYFH